jgi:hypothetical protein
VQVIATQASQPKHKRKTHLLVAEEDSWPKLVLEKEATMRKNRLLSVSDITRPKNTTGKRTETQQPVDAEAGVHTTLRR